jgi:hypothetical protein
MKPIVQKVLESGLIDKGTADLMEIWGYLPHGASESVNEGALADATQEKLKNLAKDLGNAIEKEHHLRETYLDLERLRWPATVYIGFPKEAYNGGSKLTTTLAHTTPLQAVMDRMGRYYFRIQDVDEKWFVPGFILSRESPRGLREEMITQSQVLYSGVQGICVQVSTDTDHATVRPHNPEK